MKTSELTGAALDWAVATCEADDGQWVLDGRVVYHAGYAFRPSTDWSLAGPIIERERLDIEWVAPDCCRATYDRLYEGFYEAFGPTPLIAAMRCYVASKMGEQLEFFPKELT